MCLSSFATFTSLPLCLLYALSFSDSIRWLRFENEIENRRMGRSELKDKHIGLRFPEFTKYSFGASTKQVLLHIQRNLYSTTAWLLRHSGFCEVKVDVLWFHE